MAGYLAPTLPRRVADRTFQPLSGGPECSPCPNQNLTLAATVRVESKEPLETNSNHRDPGGQRDLDLSVNGDAFEATWSMVSCATVSCEWEPVGTCGQHKPPRLKRSCTRPWVLSHGAWRGTVGETQGRGGGEGAPKTGSPCEAFTGPS